MNKKKQTVFEGMKSLNTNLTGVDAFIVKSIISLVGSVGRKFCNGGELKFIRGFGKGVIGQD
jgi:hypothetical protein